MARSMLEVSVVALSLTGVREMGSDFPFPLL